MNLLKIEKDIFLPLLKKIPACDNYHDSLIAQGDDYLSKYQFFRLAEDDLFGISPEGNQHLYTSKEEALKLFLQDSRSLDCKLIFSYFQNDPHLMRLLPGDWVAKPFYYLNKSPSQSIATGLERLHVRQAIKGDQSLVNHWYSTFNQEEGSNWSIPDLNSIPSPRLFLAFLDEKFVGAAANTLCSNDRLWVGRLWVDKPARNKGIGQDIMRNLETYALKETKTINLLVSKENEAALNLYKNMNFDKISLNCFWYNQEN